MSFHVGEPVSLICQLSAGPDGLLRVGAVSHDSLDNDAVQWTNADKATWCVRVRVCACTCVRVCVCARLVCAQRVCARMFVFVCVCVRCVCPRVRVRAIDVRARGVRACVFVLAYVVMGVRAMCACVCVMGVHTRRDEAIREPCFLVSDSPQVHAHRDLVKA
jgi:hypothetical protein